MNRFTCFFLLTLPVLFGGCYGDRVEQQLGREPFFDLKGYMQQQIDSLAQAQVSVRKRITLNGQQEEHLLREINFASELAIFENSDINRPAWLEKYEVDSLRENGKLLAVRYTAQDPDLRTRELLIRFAGEAVGEISVLNQTSTVLSEGEQELTYRPGRAYLIRTWQKTPTTDTLRSYIEGNILKP